MARFTDCSNELLGGYTAVIARAPSSSSGMNSEPRPVKSAEPPKKRTIAVIAVPQRRRMVNSNAGRYHVSSWWSTGFSFSCRARRK